MIAATPFKSDFPIFQHHPDLCYLDSAATTHKHAQVIHAIDTFYSESYGTVSRGLYPLSANVTDKVNECRNVVAQFIGATHAQDIAFTYGATDAINKVAQNFLKPRIESGTNVVITAMEHHANILPWQLLAKENGLELRIVRLTDTQEVDLNHLEELLDRKTILLSITHVSNVLGICNPLAEIIERAKSYDAPVLVDAAQSIVLKSIDVQRAGVDFLVFSGHKMFGPTGIGILYTSPRYQPDFHPHLVGGGMVREVSFDRTEYATYPSLLEPGTPNIAGIIGLKAAIEFIHGIDREQEDDRLNRLGRSLKEDLNGYEDIRLLSGVGTDSHIVSFDIPGIHPHDIAYFLGGHEICVRAGHHCAEPLHMALNCHASIRVSLSIYNDYRDVTKFMNTLDQCITYFK